jgi:hypothetical protein
VLSAIHGIVDLDLESVRERGEEQPRLSSKDKLSDKRVARLKLYRNYALLIVD